MTASAVWHDPKDHTTYDPSNVVDGSLSTRWACGPAGTHQAWLVLDFKKEVEFDKFRIAEYSDRIRQYQIEVPDGEDRWKAIYSGTSIGTRCEVSLPETKSQKIRLNILSATDSPSIYEIKVMSNK